MVLVVEKRVTSPLLVSKRVTAGLAASTSSTKSNALLQEPSSIQKIAEIDQHIGVAMSGLTADAKTLIDRARVETQVKVRTCVAWPSSAFCVLNLELMTQTSWPETPLYLLAATSIQL